VRFAVQAPATWPSTSATARCAAAPLYLHSIVPRARFRFAAGEESLTTYTFNTGTARHRSAATAGSSRFYVPRSHPDGISVNVALSRAEHMGTGIERSAAVNGREWKSITPRVAGCSFRDDR
jgi:hypothetical protein